MTAKSFTVAELGNYIESTSMSAASAVRAVLACTRASSQGNKCSWPAAAGMTVRDVVNSSVFSPVPGIEGPVPAVHPVMALVAKAVGLHLAFIRELPAEGLLSSAEKRQALLTATNEFLRPHLDENVAQLLKNTENEDGFFRGYPTYDLAGLEQLISFGEKPSSTVGSKRVADEVLEDGYRLLVWRSRRREEAQAGERLYDTTALLLDDMGQPAAYADVRLMFLSPGSMAEGLGVTLDAYDAQGLELGAALESFMEAEHYDEFEQMEFLSEGILHLQKVEVRKDLRGRGLGALFLKAVLPLAAKCPKGYAVRKMVLAAQPLQFDFPLQGLTPDLQMEALDATERLFEYLERVRLQDSVPHLRGADLVYLATDPRATGSHVEQLALVAELLEKQKSTAI